MIKYDAVVVLGSQPDITTWEFPQQVYQCLDFAKSILDLGQVDQIIVSGKSSTALDNIGVIQPFRECDKMADYLLAQGVSNNKILREFNSQDTISNLYYLKSEIFIPNRFNKLLFPVADFRIPRLQFLCERILGSEYEIDFEPIPSELSASYNEPLAFKMQKEFLEPMESGQHEWLADKFFTAPMYEFWRKHDIEKYAN